ncbi:MAG: hypothetical protein Q7K57_19060 [Burkholderiaceae bacterium]|nr:hypothetical protein [Burkholderiaceae bacterium]
MNKSTLLFFFATIGSGFFLVQAGNLITSAETSERAKLVQEREKIEAEFTSKETGCYKTFAVDSCLKKAHTEKRAALAEIKRQELVINDLQRQKKKAEIDSKISKSPAANPSATGVDSFNRSVNPSNDERKRVEAANKRAKETSHKMMASQAKAAQRVEKTKLANEKAAKYQKKLLEAEEHKAATEQKMTNNTKPKALPLPLPKSPGN